MLVVRTIQSFKQNRYNLSILFIAPCSPIPNCPPMFMQLSTGGMNVPNKCYLFSKTVQLFYDNLVSVDFLLIVEYISFLTALNSCPSKALDGFNYLLSDSIKFTWCHKKKTLKRNSSAFDNLRLGDN